MEKTVVTGGAGFIGSHIVDGLLEQGYEVIAYASLVTGDIKFLDKAKQNPNFRLVEKDLLEKEALEKAVEGSEVVFHIAANADIRDAMNNTFRDLEQNLVATYNVLEAMRKHGVKKLMFTSSAAIYGEPDVFPTPENYAPHQTSTYGAAKISSEAFIQAYCEYYDMKAWIYRFVLLMGDRYAHGVALDFFQQLTAHPDYLQFLADGSQRKSYLDVEDAVRGIFISMEKPQEKVNIFNLGHDDILDVKALADVVCDEMGLLNVEYKFKDRKRGWIGDSPLVQLDTKKLKSLGWSAQTSLEGVIRNTVKYLKTRDPKELRSH